MTSLESRAPVSNPFGKCDRRLDIPVSEALEERIIAMAALNGVPKAEYVRRVLERAMYGEFAIAQSLAADRLGSHREN
jgi:predicted DNA binding CopG/RHH family protein